MAEDSDTGKQVSIRATKMILPPTVALKATEMILPPPVAPTATKLILHQESCIISNIASYVAIAISHACTAKITLAEWFILYVYVTSYVLEMSH